MVARERAGLASQVTRAFDGYLARPGPIAEAERHSVGERLPEVPGRDRQHTEATAFCSATAPRHGSTLSPASNRWIPQ